MGVGIDIGISTSVAVNLKTLSMFCAQTMWEIAEAVGCKDCEETLRKGVVERHIIDTMEIRFIAEENGSEIIKGELILEINWERANLLAEGRLAQVLSENFADGKPFVPRITNGLLSFLKRRTTEIKKEYKVKHVSSSYQYRREYREDSQKHTAAMAYLGHVSGKSIPRDTTGMTRELEGVIQALQGMLVVKYKW